MSMFEKLKTSLKKVVIDGEEYFLAEGDTLLDIEQLRIYADSRERIEQAREALARADDAGMGAVGLAEPGPRSMVGLMQSGKHVRWKPGTTLSYRIVKDSFPESTRYDLVRICMAQATDAWENTCGVTFQHFEVLDVRPGIETEGAVFTVRFSDQGGAFAVAAFFPNDHINRRRILVDPSFFAPDLGFSQIGIFRHELGHVLGFKHEHIRSNAPPDCPDELLFDADNLTKYDPQSVMHYFCGDVGSRDLEITALDEIGAQRIYGPPLSRVKDIEP